jgi:hypothetical protein
MNRMLLEKSCIGLCILSVFFGKCFAEDKGEKKGSEKQIAKIVWLEVDKAGALPSAARLDKDDKFGDVVKIARTPDVPQLIEIATIEKPAVTLRAYMLRGKVKFAGVGGEGFLEIWNHFPEPKKGAYFSRTMAESGSMGKLRGDSPWRDFVLPFNFDDAAFPMPEKIQFNVYLPQNGTVWISDLELIEFPPEELSKQIAGAATPAAMFTRWMSMTVLMIVAFAVITVVARVAFASLVYMKSRRIQVNELRRMQAMDIG